MNYAVLKTYIDTYIKENGVEGITGDILNAVLKRMTDDLGDYRFSGVIVPSSIAPQVTDINRWFITSTNGTYTNFGDIEVLDELVIITFDGTFHKFSVMSKTIEAGSVITEDRSVIQGLSIDAQMQFVNDNMVVGPASSIDNSIPVFDGITGKLLKGTGVSIVSGNIVGNNSSFIISTDSADGADNKRVQIVGGGSPSATRGAYINIYGNDIATNGGDLDLIAGDGINGKLGFYTGTLNERMRLEKGGNLGIGTAALGAAKGKLDISNGGIGLIVGADNTLDTRTNLNPKYGRIASPHYTNTEEPIGLITGVSDTQQNRVWIGGGTSTVNTATIIQFFTASNQTTLTGTERMRIVNDGKVGIGTTSPSEKLDVNGNIAVSGSVKIGTDATAASSSNVGAIRYTSTANSSSMEMVMQTGASTYAWVVIKTNTW